MVKVAVLVSGGGSNLQAILDAKAAGRLENTELCAVISSCEDAYALTRAERFGVPRFVINHSDYKTREAFTDAVLELLNKTGAELVVLAGFMFILSPKFCAAYKNRVINVHPSLIPAFCGDGFYGLRVHRAALDYGVKLTGATVHFVSEVTDGGPIILQKSVEIREEDTPETLQKRVMEQCEWVILPEAVRLFCAGELRVTDGKVHIGGLSK
ncbi:MAG: phosphoribosylglycinamide formyltransferase [Clostridia bacterium]